MTTAERITGAAAILWTRMEMASAITTNPARAGVKAGAAAVRAVAETAAGEAGAGKQQEYL